ncbi:hypothetical protein HUA76_23020 [Myxococcus sp. CA056]|uniref:hypothetical protein n=1 Tax=Myxococcus sp. CA056 TaxID=2741740 RepID=UPI00157B362E|nr:hypothetical protein [Myxococcus sp. CA056]NTX13683.1 hypothetical protein [Myxococcus sp. CA056]
MVLIGHLSHPVELTFPLSSVTPVPGLGEGVDAAQLQLVKVGCRQILHVQDQGIESHAPQFIQRDLCLVDVWEILRITRIRGDSIRIVEGANHEESLAFVNPEGCSISGPRNFGRVADRPWVQGAAIRISERDLRHDQTQRGDGDRQ